MNGKMMKEKNMYTASITSQEVLVKKVMKRSMPKKGASQKECRKVKESRKKMKKEQKETKREFCHDYMSASSPWKRSRS